MLLSGSRNEGLFYRVMRFIENQRGILSVVIETNIAKGLTNFGSVTEWLPPLPSAEYPCGNLEY